MEKVEHIVSAVTVQPHDVGDMFQDDKLDHSSQNDDEEDDVLGEYSFFTELNFCV